jgi:hypothetical protein
MGAAADRSRVTRPVLALTLLVAAALGTGLFAFLVATPDQAGRVSATELGFERLDRATIAQGMANAGATLRAAHAERIARGEAVGAARRWLAQVPAGAPPSPRGAAITRIDAATPEAATRIVGFTRWGDELLSDAWRATASSPVPAAGSERTWVVDGIVEITVAQARARQRRQRVEVVLTIAAAGPADAVPPASWRIVDLNVDSPRALVRGYADPVQARVGSIDAIGPAAARAEVEQVARSAGAQLPRLRRAWSGVAGSPLATVWIAQDDAQLRAALGAGTIDARDTLHPIVWVDGRGEVAVDLAQWRASGAATRNRALRHALVHVALLGGVERVPPLLVEGIAMAEARRGADGIEVEEAALETVSRPAPEGGDDIAELLVARPGGTLDPDARARALVTAAWLLDRHGQAGAVTWLARIAGGTSVVDATSGLLRATPDRLELQVRAWAADQLGTTSETDPTDAPGATP